MIIFSGKQRKQSNGALKITNEEVQVLIMLYNIYFYLLIMTHFFIRPKIDFHGYKILKIV